jgi:hypothetical protein
MVKMSYLAIFRSCLRKEYADQVIKMLRAAEGEHTRTSYRLEWVTDEALDVLKREGNPLCIASITNRTGTHALPTRILTVLDHAIDYDSGMLRLLLEVGPFIQVEKEFSGEISAWGVTDKECPPEKFVTEYKANWPKFNEAKTNALTSWRRAVDFATTNWDLKNTVFLRPVDSNLEGQEREIQVTVGQGTKYRFEIASYNPHLTDVDINLKQIQVTASGAIADVGQVPAISRDGIIPIEFKFLEPGKSKIEIHVQPDPQFSTYIPIGIEVKSDPQLDPVGPRLLGSEWAICLDELSQIFSSNTDLQLKVLKTLLNAFPNEPELLLRKGYMHLIRGENHVAIDIFNNVLKVRESARGVTWLLIASLRIGAVRESENLLQRLNLSENSLFQQIVDAASGIDEQTVMRFVDFPGLYLSEDKAIKFVLALGEAAESQEVAQKVMSALAELDESQALTYSKKCLIRNQNWRNLRRDYVLLADRLNLSEGVNEHAGLILRYRDESPTEIVERVGRLSSKVHPVEMLGILLFNATAFAVGSDDEKKSACIDQSLKAAELAYELCDYASADHALQILTQKLKMSDPVSVGFLKAAEQIGMRINKIRFKPENKDNTKNTYSDFLLQSLAPHLTGKILAILGGQEDLLLMEYWKTSLGLEDISWITDISLNPSKDRQLLEFEPTKLVVVMVWGDVVVCSEEVQQWLDDNSVQVCTAFMVPESILYSLERRIVPRSVNSATSNIDKPSEVVTFARVHLKNLIINDETDKSVKELDAYPLAGAWAKKILRSLVALDDYCVWRASKNSGGVNFLTWLGQNDSIPPNWISMKESESLENNSTHYQKRVFPVDESVDQSGSVYMEAHVKLDFDHPAPRIHFYDASGMKIKKIFIGYIGEHLPTPSGH